MGLGDILKKVGDAASSMAEEKRQNDKLRDFKQSIIEKLSTNQIINIVDYYGVKLTDPEDSVNLNKYFIFSKDYGKFDTPKKKKFVPRRDDYTNALMEKVRVDDIIDYCRKRGFREIETLVRGRKEYMDKNCIDASGKKLPIIEKEIIKDFEASQKEVTHEQTESTSQMPNNEVTEKTITSVEIKTQNEFDSILETIDEQFEPEDVRDENDFEKQLTQFLKIKYPNRVKRQVDTPKGKIDILIDEKYAFELKIADNKLKLRDLIGQVGSYKKIYNDVSVILLDAQKMNHSEIQEFLDDYNKIGVKTVVKDGVLKRRQFRSKRININFR